ncbi:hypothetical protein ACFCP7_26745 [Paenibacillus elgii]
MADGRRALDFHGDRSVKKGRAAFEQTLSYLPAACPGCSIFGSNVALRTTPVDAEASQALDETGDLLVAGDQRVFSVNSKTNEA